MRHRERSDHDGVDQRVDRRVRADAECQRRDRHRGEGRGVQQRAEAIAHVAHEGIEPGDHVRVARALALERGVAELSPRDQRCLVFGHPLQAQLLDPLVEVKGDLALDVARQALGAANVEQATEERHGLWALGYGLWEIARHA